MQQPISINEDFLKLNSSILESTLYCHPDNYELLKSQLTTLAESEGIHLIRGPSTRIIQNEFLEKRKISHVWHPPKGERFVEYEYSDEDWMRPLGLGRIEEVDEGPVFFVNIPAKRKPFRGIKVI